MTQRCVHCARIITFTEVANCDRKCFGCTNVLSYDTIESKPNYKIDLSKFIVDLQKGDNPKPLLVI